MRVLIGETLIHGRPAVLYIEPGDDSSSVRIGDPDVDYVVPGPTISAYVDALRRLCITGGLLPHA